MTRPSLRECINKSIRQHYKTQRTSANERVGESRDSSIESQRSTYEKHGRLVLLGPQCTLCLIGLLFLTAGIVPSSARQFKKQMDPKKGDDMQEQIPVISKGAKSSNGEYSGSRKGSAKKKTLVPKETKELFKTKGKRTKTKSKGGGHCVGVIAFSGITTAFSYMRGQAELAWKAGAVVNSLEQRVPVEDCKDMVYYVYLSTNDEWSCHPDRLPPASLLVATTTKVSQKMSGLIPGQEYSALVKAVTTGEELISESCSTAEFQVQTVDSAFKAGIEHIVGPLTASPTMSITKNGSILVYESEASLPEEILSITEGVVVTGFDNIYYPFSSRVVFMSEVSNTRVRLIVMDVGINDVFDTLALSVSTMLLPQGLDPDEDTNSNIRRLKTIKFEDDIISANFNVLALTGNIFETLPPYAKLRKLELTFTVRLNATFTKNFGENVIFDGSMEFLYGAAADIGLEFEEETPWDQFKFPLPSGHELMHFRKVLPIGWFPLLLEFKPTAYYFFSLEVKGTLKAGLVLEVPQRGKAIDFGYNEQKGGIYGPTFRDINPESDLVVKPQLEVEAGASLKTGFGLHLDFMVQRLVGLEGVLELNIMKLAAKMAIDFEQSARLGIPAIPRFGDLSIVTDIELQVFFKYFNVEAVFGKDCVETCAEDCGIDEDDDRLTREQEDCVTDCLMLCDEFWIKKPLMSVEVFPLIRWYSLPMLGIKAADGSEILLCEKDRPKVVEAFATVEVMQIQFPPPIFSSQVDTPFRWKVFWEDGTTYWSKDESTNESKTVKMILPQRSKLDSRVDCEWPRGEIYVEVTPYIFSIPLKYTILVKAYLKDVFKAKLEPGQPAIPLPPPNVIEEGDECDAGNGRTGECQTSCNGEEQFSVAGLCKDDKTGLSCCLTSEPCSAFDWGIGGSGICRKTENCPQTGAGQFVAVEDDCPGDNSVKCCLADVKCRTRDGYKGKCRPKSTCPNTPSQFYDSNLCPGDSNIKCCLSNVPCEYNRIEGICQHINFCAKTANKVNAKHLCPGDVDIRCCLSNVTCVSDVRNEGVCRRESNCPSTRTQIPANGTSICPRDYDYIQNVCCLSNVGCKTSEGNTGVCVDPSLCPITDVQFPVSDGDCPFSIQGPSVCCLSDVSCETSRKNVGQCKDDSFCPSEGTNVHLDSFCPLSAAPGNGCCLSNVPCMAPDGHTGVCKRNCEFQDGLCEWDVLGTDCPGAPGVRCFVAPRPMEWDETGVLLGVNGADQFGAGLTVSEDGSVVAAGAPSANGGGGYVKVFHYNRAQWRTKGRPVSGSQLGSRFGHSLAMSSEGDTLVIGAPSCSGGADPLTGCVFVYEFEDNDWVLKGNPIYGKEKKEGFGTSIDVSKDGKTIAIGAPHYFYSLGRVDVYGWVRDSWRHRVNGDSIYGNEWGDMTGAAVALAAGGQGLVVGAPAAQVMVGADMLIAGRVRAYTSNGFQWQQLGEDITGEQNYANFGASVDVSNDLSTIIVGTSRFNALEVEDAGHAQVFRYQSAEANDDERRWVEMNSRLYGEQAGDQLGHSVAIDPDAGFIAVGAPKAGTAASGRTRLYGFHYDKWRYLGFEIKGMMRNSRSGSGLAMSGGARTLAVYEESQDQSGRVRIYSLGTSVHPTVAPVPTVTPVPTPEPGSCVPGEIDLHWNIRTDQYADVEENSWSVSLYGEVVALEENMEPESYYEGFQCFPENCYLLSYYDHSGDGFVRGGFTFRSEGNIVAYHQSGDSWRSLYEFGDCGGIG